MTMQQLRMIRDNKIINLDWMRHRYMDEVSLSRTPTLTRAQFLELLAYIQALRDLPDNTTDLDNVVWPTKPSFVS